MFNIIFQDSGSSIVHDIAVLHHTSQECLQINNRNEKKSNKICKSELVIILINKILKSKPVGNFYK